MAAVVPELLEADRETLNRVLAVTKALEKGTNLGSAARWRVAAAVVLATEMRRVNDDRENQ